MSERIQQALLKVFERHRIVFWRDAKKELRNDLEWPQLTGMQKIGLTNNKFGVKQRIPCEEPENKFLLNHEEPQSEDLENWLLDVQLTQGEFRAGQVAICLSELELDLQLADLVQAHVEFSRAVKRKDSRKRLLSGDDTPGMIQIPFSFALYPFHALSSYPVLVFDCTQFCESPCPAVLFLLMVHY